MLPVSVLGDRPPIAPTLPLSRRVAWLFDLDGTLVDSSPAHESAFHEALSLHGPDLRETFRYGVHTGRSTREVFERLGVTDNGLLARLVAAKQSAYRALAGAGRVGLCPGAHELLTELAQRARPVYLVTSGSRVSVQTVLRTCSLTGLVRGVITGDDVVRNKPDPSIYRTACRRWFLDPAQVVAVEDSQNGVTAAISAGIATVRVHSTGTALGPSPDVVDAGTLPGLLSMLRDEGIDDA